MAKCRSSLFTRVPSTCPCRDNRRWEGSVGAGCATSALQRGRGRDTDPSHQPQGSLAGLSFPAVFPQSLGAPCSCQQLWDLYKVQGGAGACRKEGMDVEGRTWLAHLLWGCL